MEYLDILQATLTETCDIICEEYDLDRQEVFDKTEIFIKKNSAKWRQSDPDIDYEDPFCRMAYIYMNVAIHAHLIKQALSSFPRTTELIRDRIGSGEALRVCALGGGPGSELLGLVDFIEELKPAGAPVYLDFVLVDRVKEWDESWHALKQGIDNRLRAQYGSNRGRWPILISRSFLSLDAANLDDFRSFSTRFSDTDLYILSYLVSEMQASVTHLASVLEFLTARSDPGSLVLFIDRNQRAVREVVGTLIDQNDGLASLGLSKERGRLIIDLTELGEWYIHIPSVPRQKWLTFFALGEIQAGS
jgi:hypothetical protein